MTRVTKRLTGYMETARQHRMFGAWADAALDAATDGWARSIAAFGGRYATLVAKHVCGFAVWPTNATLRRPDAGAGHANATWRYQYRTPDELDVVASFGRACARHGIGLGIYYSVNANEYLNYANGVRDPATLRPGQQRVTQAEYNDIVLQQLGELWGRYGDLAEIWFSTTIAPQTEHGRSL